MDKPRFWLDAWVDWEHFIEQGSDVPERILAGLNCRPTFLKSNNNWQLIVPLEVVANHVGGQITLTEREPQTLIDALCGLELAKHWAGIGMKSCGIRSDLIGFRELTDMAGHKFYSGWAVYHQIYARWDKFQVTGGHFYGHNFFAPLGNYLFQSLSGFLPAAYRKHPRLATLKAGYGYPVLKQLKLEAMVEGYYNYPLHHLDYSFGLNLAFLPTWTLAKVPMD